MLRSKNYSDADFSFLQLNIRSLPHNLVKLTDYLSCLNIKFSVIGISETWLNDSSHSVDISGFKFLHKLEDAKSNTHASSWKFLNKVLNRKKAKASIKYNI